MKSFVPTEEEPVPPSEVWQYFKTEQRTRLMRQLVLMANELVNAQAEHDEPAVEKLRPSQHEDHLKS